MIDVLGSQSCCGVGELCDITQVNNENVHNEFESILEKMFGYGGVLYPIVIFTGVTFESGGVRPGYIEALCAFIEKHNLGALKKSRARKNPNTGRWVTAVLWDVHKTNLTKFAKKEYGIIKEKLADDNWF